MKTKLFILILSCCASISPAFAEVVNENYETSFAGYPSGHGQYGLRELQPALFAREKMDRESGCLAAALYFEARGESQLGQIAVAQVIVNRARSGYFPDSICRVVWQNSHKRNRCQFSFTCDGKADSVRDFESWQVAKKIALGFTTNRFAKTLSKEKHPAELLPRQTRRSTHYHANYVTPDWSSKLKRMGRIGQHIFYVSSRVEKTMPTGT